MKNEANKNIVLNLDGDFICNRETGDFAICFSDAQKEALRHAINYYPTCPIEALGYKHVPPEYVYLVCKILYTYPTKTVIRPVDVWKIVHMGLDIMQFYWTCLALRNNVFLADNVENVRLFDAGYIENIAIASVYRVDYSNRLNVNITEKETQDLQEDILKLINNPPVYVSSYDDQLIRNAEEIIKEAVN